MATVAVAHGGTQREIPLSQLGLPSGFSDNQLRRAVAAHLETSASEFSGHRVVRDEGRIELRGESDFRDPLVVRFILWGVTFLLIGTVQGVVQVMPDVRRWIMTTGGAGHLIDPLAHAHVNLVGGVVMIAIATCYYLLPRALGRPLYSQRMAWFSLWGMAIGVSMWYGSMLALGLSEGHMMIREGIGFHEAKAAHQPWHTLGLAVPAAVMGLGHWVFIATVYLTVFRPRQR